MSDKKRLKKSSDHQWGRDAEVFHRMLVNRATLGLNGSLRLAWDSCDCGTIRAMEKLEEYTIAERVALRCTGLTGKIEDGIPCIRAIVLKRQFRCDRGHLHDAERAAFCCPFGPSPHCVLKHGWGPDDRGRRGPHCRGPLRPEGDYRLVVEDPGLPPRMIGLVWGCPLDRRRRELRSLSERGNDVPARS